MAVDWQSYKAHRDHVASTQGLWVGLANENGEPIMDFPPILQLEAPATRNVPVSFRATVVVRSPRGVVHQIVDELFAEGFSDVNVDREGRLEVVLDSTRFIYVQKEKLRAYRITHCVVSGGFESPTQIEIHGADMLEELNRHVAWSSPARELGKFVTFTRDWAGPSNVGVTFTKPRQLQDFKLVTVADGVTLSGPAEDVIREIIEVSLQTGWFRTGLQWVVDDPPIVVDPTPSGVESPEILLRANDEKLLDTVAPLASAAGVNIRASMWLPGDPPVAGLKLTTPKIVIQVQYSGEVV